MTTASTQQGEVVTKGQFAAIIGVTPGRVSQYIADRKISGDALVGEGRSAKINVNVAKAQLRARLDLGQRLGNGLDTHLAETPPTQPGGQVADLLEPQAHGGALLRRQAPEADPIEERIKLARLAEYEARNRKTAEEELARRGLYTPTAEVRAGMGRVASSLVDIFEGGLTDLASAISEEFAIPHRDALHTVRKAFRDVRTRAAAELAKTADTLAPTRLDEVADASDPAAGSA